ncbi:MAG: efflux RND transporter periplasmic adaptor subunit [Acutalibacteraceae bacterium]
MKKRGRGEKKKLTKNDVNELVTIYDKCGVVDKFKALSKKKQIAVLVSAVCVLVAIIVAIVVAARPKYTAEVGLVEVTTGNVTETISSTGTVVSTSKDSFKIFDGVKVKKLNFKLGDQVKKGDVIATFDCSAAAKLVSEKKDAYEQAKSAYEDTMNAAKTAKTTLPQVEKKLEQLKKEIDALQKEEESKQQESTQATTQSSGGLLTRLEKLVENLSKLGGSFDMSSVMGSSSSGIQLQMEYVELLTQKATLEAQSNEATQQFYKLLMDSSKKTYEEYKDVYSKLEKGWTVEQDGIITTLNIKEGEKFDSQKAPTSTQSIDLSTVVSALNGGVDVDQLVSSLTQSAVATAAVVDNYADFEIEFEISKYDIPKVKLNQKATITALNDEFEGYVSYISPTVETSSSSLDISSIAGSLTGGSSSAGLKGKLKVKNPGASVIIGLTVDIVIETNYVENVTVVPLEGIEIDGKDYYAYVYDAKTKEIEKRQLEVGISSDTLYEIKSGCSVGDKLVKNPTNALIDGSKVKVTK